MIILGIVSFTVFLVVVTSSDSVPNSGINALQIFTILFCLIILNLGIAFTQLFKVSSKRKKATFILISIGITLGIALFIMRHFHLPGAGVLLILLSLYACFAIGPLVVKNRYEKWRGYTKSWQYTFFLSLGDLLGVTLLVLGYVFKTMYWPGSTLMLSFGAVIFLAAVFGWMRLFKAIVIKQKQTEEELAEQNALVQRQKEVVEEAHKEITDSINYAERIQRSFLATDEILNKHLKDYFVFFKPKEAVSGDFYWAGELANGNFAMVNADSTGHGVPGAIMSILNITSIEKAVEQKVSEPAEIFNLARKNIIQRLKKDGSTEGGKDGMDASIVCFDFENSGFTYAAAQNPIWVIRNKELIEIKPNKMPIGKHDKDHIPFSGGEFEMQKGDQIYTLTDGFQDQFGGPKGKKFMVKKMREHLLSVSHLSMEDQHNYIRKTFTDWQGELEQVDDVCLIGVKF
ncbi:MAG: serine phosphatase RsbU (regulator of sigma subunit) [Arenicella sp.]|jgi:serine phosphatase RsbU (regulator of sigma subunit)